LQPFGDFDGASWFCLQREEPDAIPFPGAVPLGGLLDKFEDTIYAISQMDMVVTVDTSIAHIAGALGVPVKIMVSFLPDWRWLLWRDDSPWYPSMKIYRQPLPGDWQSVIMQVRDEL
jgi:hypothetical protein